MFADTHQNDLNSPQEVAVMHILDQIGQALKERGIDLEELIESGREIRGE